MKFEPFHDKIEVRPLKREGVLMSPDNENFLEVGEVLSIGQAVKDAHMPFLEVGDLVAYVGYGVFETDYDGTTRYLITYSPEYILGKYVEEK